MTDGCEACRPKILLEDGPCKGVITPYFRRREAVQDGIDPTLFHMYIFRDGPYYKYEYSFRKVDLNA